MPTQEVQQVPQLRGAYAHGTSPQYQPVGAPIQMLPCSSLSGDHAPGFSTTGLPPQDDLNEQDRSRHLSSTSCMKGLNAQNPQLLPSTSNPTGWQTENWTAGSHASWSGAVNGPRDLNQYEHPKRLKRNNVNPALVSHEQNSTNTHEMECLLDMTFESIVFPDSSSGPSVGKGHGSGLLLSLDNVNKDPLDAVVSEVTNHAQIPFSLLLLIVAVGGFKYALTTPVSYAAPLVCSFAGIVLCILILILLPWKNVACLPVYAWGAIVALAPVLFLLNDFNKTTTQITTQMTAVLSFSPLLAAQFCAIGASVATMPITRNRSILCLAIMLTNSGIRHSYVASITGLDCINLQIWGLTAVASGLGYSACVGMAALACEWKSTASQPAGQPKLQKSHLNCQLKQ